MRAKLAEVKTQLRRRMHDPIPVQGRWLARVLQGHVAYYAVPGNSNAVSAFRYQVSLHWRRTLRRRSQRGRITWATDGPVRNSVAPASPCDASLPERALRSQNLRQEPDAVVPHVGIRAGGRP